FAGKRVCIGELAELTMTVDRQSEKHQRKEEGSSYEKQSGVTLCHDWNKTGRKRRKASWSTFTRYRQPSDTDDVPVLDDDERCIDATDDPQEQDEITQGSKKLERKARATVGKWCARW